MKRVHFWQGEPSKVIFGYCEPKKNEEKPMYWYNYEASLNMNIPCVKVLVSGQEFVIANHFGIGSYKLRNGGWPNIRHFSADDLKFIEAEGKSEMYIYANKKFDLEMFEKFEAERKNWQKENYPEEYEKHKRLLESFKLTRK